MDAGAGSGSVSWATLGLSSLIALVCSLLAFLGARRNAKAVVESARTQADAAVASARQQALETEQLRLRCEIVQRRLTEFDEAARDFMRGAPQFFTDMTADANALRFRLTVPAFLAADSQDYPKLTEYWLTFDKAYVRLMVAMRRFGAISTPGNDRDRFMPVREEWQQTVVALHLLRHVVDWASERRLAQATGPVPSDIPDAVKTWKDVLP